jgi:Tfp pilus assembly protein PilN
MIKINLSPVKKQADLTNVGGFDLTKVKIVPLLLFIGIMYVPDLFLSSMWEEERNKATQQIDVKRQELSKLKREVAQSQALEKQIRELKAQEENLGQKLVAVKQAISEKKNPKSLLHYLAKNVPNELWIRELTLEDDTLSIKGEALDYGSIGAFVNGMKSSVFVREANLTGVTSSVREGDKRRVESFEVKFQIARFEQ